MIADFGGDVAETPAGFHVRAGRTLRGRDYAIEPDASSASYPFALAAALGGSVAVPGLGRDAQQGDYAFTAILEQAGAAVTRARRPRASNGSARCAASTSTCTTSPTR